MAKHITARLSEEVYERVFSLANDDCRTLTAEIEYLLRTHPVIKLQGLDPTDEATQKQNVVPATRPDPTAVRRRVEESSKPYHDPKTCRVYGCLMCKALKDRVKAQEVEF